MRIIKILVTTFRVWHTRRKSNTTVFFRIRPGNFSSSVYIVTWCIILPHFLFFLLRASLHPHILHTFSTQWPVFFSFFNLVPGVILSRTLEFMFCRLSALYWELTLMLEFSPSPNIHSSCLWSDLHLWPGSWFLLLCSLSSQDPIYSPKLSLIQMTFLCEAFP